MLMSPVVPRSLVSLLSLLTFACGGLIESSTFDEEDLDVDLDAGGDGDLTPSGSGGASDGTLSSGGSLSVEETPDDLTAENVDCTGSFGEAELLFEDPGWVPQALSPTRDGLEIFYGRLAIDKSLDDSGKRRFAVRSRASVNEKFSDPVPLVDLDEACEKAESGTEPSALDVSGDALRLYIGCNAFSGAPYPLGPLLLATRLDRSSPFVVAAEPIGWAGISLGLTKDELEGFGSSLDPAVPEVLYYSRNSMDESFSPGVVAPGGVEMLNPEPAPDGLALLGVVSDDITLKARIASSVRTELGAPFSQPTTEGMPPPGVECNDYSPALTANCREIYFLRLYPLPNYHAEVMVSRR